MNQVTVILQRYTLKKKYKFRFVYREMKNAIEERYMDSGTKKVSDIIFLVQH